jgi:hypothetical protein
MKYKPGNYMVVGFNDIGTKLATFISDGDGRLTTLGRAETVGQQAVNSGHWKSYAVLRVIQNSKVQGGLHGNHDVE